MKAVLYRIYNHPTYSKVFHWGKLVSITGSSQLLIQAFGFLSGILIIRLLSTREYAWYTLANTMLGTMTMLADSGISNGLMAEAGVYWQDKKKLGIVLATGLNLRKIFGIISLVTVTPVLVYLLIQHGASWTITILIILSIIPAFLAALSDSLLEIVPKIHQDIKRLQRNQVEVSLGRLILSAVFVFIFPFTYIALVANSIPRIYGNYRLRKISARFANNNEKSERVVQKQILKSVKRTVPIVLYHCLSSQISIWLLSFFGTTASISEIGALGRLAILFNLCSIVVSTLLIPRFARMKASKEALLKNFLLIQLATFFACIFLLMAIGLFSNQILWVLGKKYYGLHYELILIGMSSSIALMAGICGQLVISRGWYMNPYLFIAINFISTVFYIAFFNVSTLVNILYFNIAVSSLEYASLFIYGLIQLAKPMKEQP